MQIRDLIRSNIYKNHRARAEFRNRQGSRTAGTDTFKFHEVKQRQNTKAKVIDRNIHYIILVLTQSSKAIWQGRKGKIGLNTCGK